MSEIKIKRVFQLKKKSENPPLISEQPPKQPPSLLEKSNLTVRKTLQQSDIYFDTVQNQEIQENTRRPNVEGPQLVLDTSYLNFQKLIQRVDTRQIRVSNVGSAAIYYQWIRVPQTKINAHSIVDENPKFWCHQQKNVIKPGEQITFVFSFMSKIPGIFIEQFEFKCQPAPLTPLPLLKLEGKAIIIDEFSKSRASFAQKLRKSYVQKTIRQIISDLIDGVKSPEEPRPDMSIPDVALRVFQKKNKNYGLFYNKTVFRWWNQLYTQTCSHLGIKDNYWNGSVDKLNLLIDTLQDEDIKISYKQRWQNYFHLSRKRDTNRSIFFKQTKEALSKLSLSIAGEYNDTAKKELDMWEVAWRQPQDTDTEHQKKQRDEEVAKIKAEWLKKAKKKKWTEQDEKNLLNEYRNKVESKTKQYIYNFVSTLQKSGAYLKTQQILQKQPISNNYFRFFQRLKTIRECEIQGKKVVLKIHLKLRQNIGNKFDEFHQYLIKKKEQEKRLEQELKDLEKQKKKAKKNTKKKQEEEQKPLIFDILQILDEDSFNEIIEIIRFIQEKSPKTLLILCNYGPKTGKFNSRYSLQFFHTELKKNDLFVEFLPHQNIHQFNEKVENDSLIDGSIYLLENINFLPYEVMQIQQNGNVTKLLMSDIRNHLKWLQLACDIFVNQNKSESTTGIGSYLKSENVLGTSWWKHIGVCLKAQNSDLIIGGKFTPQKIELIDAARWYANRIFLTGEIGIKFLMSKNKLTTLFDFTLTHAEQIALTNLNNKIAMKWQENIPKHKRTAEPRKASIILPTDILIGKKDNDWNKTWGQKTVYDFKVNHNKQNDHIVLDIGDETIRNLLEFINNSKKIFLFDNLQVDLRSYYSTQIIFKTFYGIREKRQQRHQAELKKGINYSLDTVIILIGDFDSMAQKIQLKQVVKKSEDEEQVLEEQEQVVKNIKVIQDFYIKDVEYATRLLTGDFQAPISNINRYPRRDEDDQ